MKQTQLPCKLFTKIGGRGVPVFLPKFCVVFSKEFCKNLLLEFPKIRQNSAKVKANSENILTSTELQKAT